MALTADGTYNAEIALAVRSLAIRSSPGAVCYAEVDDRDLCAEMAARAVAMDVSSTMRLDFFSRHDRAARQLLDRYPLPADGVMTPAVLVVGSGPLAQALVIEVIRRWNRAHPTGAPTLPLRHLGTDPTTAGIASGPLVAAGAVTVTTGAADLTSIDVAADLVVDDHAGQRPPTHVFVALEVESSAIRFALRITRLLAPHDPLVVVAAATSTVFGRVLGESAATPAAVIRSRLALHNVVETVFSPEAVRRGNVEDIARAAHEAYLEHCRVRGETSSTNPSMVPWEKLPESLRDDNRSQAADVGRKLATIGATVVPTTGHDESFELTDAEVELLAEMEHDRWEGRRRTQGWTYAPTRNDKLRQHPDIVGWADLSDVSKDKDRNAVRQIPSQLGAAGFAVVGGAPVNVTRRRPT